MPVNIMLIQRADHNSLKGNHLNTIINLNYMVVCKGISVDDDVIPSR